MAIKYKKQIKKKKKNESKVQRIRSITAENDGTYSFGASHCCSWCDYDVWEWYVYCPVCGKKLIWG